MDLELTDEQTWLAESVDTLLNRHAGGDLWRHLVEFGALESLGAVELTLVARALGAHLAAVPYTVTAAARFAAPDALASVPAAETISVAVLEPAVEPAAHFVVEAARGALALVARAEAPLPGQPSLDPPVPLARLEFEAAAAGEIDGSPARL